MGSNVKYMMAMFKEAKVFNADISTWDVSNVSKMLAMFKNAYAFHGGNIYYKWDVSNVSNMYEMFYGTKVFDKDLSKWSVQNVTNMKFMFYDSSVFSQSLCWDVNGKETDDIFFGSNGGCIRSDCCPECDVELLC